MLNIEKLLVNLSGDSICGNDMEYETPFMEMETAKEGKEEVEMAGVIVESEPPNWKVVKEKALFLSEKTHDLRVVASLIEAMLNLEGFAGLEESTQLLVGLLKKYWSCLYPELDYDDAIERINALNILSSFPFNLALKKQPLVQVRGLGAFSLNNIQGKANYKNEEIPDTALINSAFQACELSELATTLENVRASVTNFNSISVLLQEKAPEDNTLDFNNVIRTLKEIEHLLQTSLQEKGGGQQSPKTAQISQPTQASQAQKTVSLSEQDISKAYNMQQPLMSNENHYSAPRAIAGDINTPDDVLKMLDKINDYYKKHEPSSPVPLLLKRAKGLVNKDFNELMQDLSPKTLKELEVVFGSDKKTKRR